MHTKFKTYPGKAYTFPLYIADGVFLFEQSIYYSILKIMNLLEVHLLVGNIYPDHDA